MKNAYTEYCLPFIQILTEIDAEVEKLGKARNVNEREMIERNIDRLEVKMYELKNAMKKLSVY